MGTTFTPFGGNGASRAASARNGFGRPLRHGGMYLMGTAPLALARIAGSRGSRLFKQAAIRARQVSAIQHFLDQILRQIVIVIGRLEAEREILARQLED